jgi:hypothetical protein
VTAPGNGSPTGTVEYFAQFSTLNIQVGQGPVNTPVQFSSDSLPPGPLTITAIYIGASNFNGSTSPRSRSCSVELGALEIVSPSLGLRARRRIPECRTAKG